MAGEWRETTLGDFVALQRGHDLTEPERKPGHVPVMGSAGQNGFHDTALAKGPGIVIGRSGASFGQVHFCVNDYWPHNTGLYVTDFKGNDPRFAFYVLKALDFDRYNSGSAQPSLNRNFIYPIPIRVPEPREQKAIAQVFGAMDDKIELNRRVNETLEALAQTFFKSWFVDSTQAALPEGWHTGTLREITGFLGGYAFKSNDWINEGVPVVKIGSVKPGIVDLNEVSFVSNAVAEEAIRFRLRVGDLVIGMTGYVGEVGLVPPTDNPPLLNQRVGKFVLEKPGTSALGFLYCFTRRPEFKADVEVKSHGTAQANVSADGILSVPVTVPPKKLVDEFNDFCEPILNRILANHAESRILAELRDTLLPKLLSGEVRVGEIEQ